MNINFIEYDSIGNKRDSTLVKDMTRSNNTKGKKGPNSSKILQMKNRLSDRRKPIWLNIKPPANIPARS